jgi:hypothetical protein
MFDLLPRDLDRTLSACERYTVAVDSDGDGENEVEDGLVACEDPTRLPGETGCTLVVDSELTRGSRLRVSIRDAFSIFRSGLAVGLGRNASGSAGRVPGGMIVSSVGVVDGDGNSEPVMFLSYAGTDGVLGFVPFDVLSSFAAASRYTLLQ